MKKKDLLFSLQKQQIVFAFAIILIFYIQFVYTIFDSKYPPKLWLELKKKKMSIDLFAELGMKKNEKHLRLINKKI